MDEEQNKEQEQQEQTMAQKAAEGVQKAAKAKDTAVQAAKIAKAAAPALLILLKLILFLVIIGALVGVVGAAVKAVIDFFSSKDVSEIVKNTGEYTTLDNKGIHINKKEMFANIRKYFADNQISLSSLGLGSEVEEQKAAEEGEEPEWSSQAEDYIYDYMKASFKSQYPYISGSDKIARGIMHIYLKNGEDNSTELTYMGYEKFQELKDSEENSDKQKLEGHYSIDENWNICIAKPTITTITNYTYQGGSGQEIEDIKKNKPIEENTSVVYTVKEIKIPYQSMISQYSMPFQFLLNLLQVTQNANYVKRVAELGVFNKTIEFTILDSTTTNTFTIESSYIKHSKGVNIIQGDPNSIDSNSVGTNSVSQGDYEEPWQTDEKYVEVQKTVREEHTIVANVTKADTWAVKQETKYEVVDTGEEVIENQTPDVSEEDEEEPEADTGSWTTNHTQTNNQIRRSIQWQEEPVTTYEINVEEFLGLLQNKLGIYYPGVKYDPEGSFVRYFVPFQIQADGEQRDRPFMNILSSEEYLISLLSENPETQNQAELMRYFMEYYKNKGQNMSEFDFSIFQTKEFKETNWNWIGSGYWWPLNDTSYTRIRSDFGERIHPITGEKKIHNGIDIPVPIGTEVIAAADGVIEKAGFSVSGGNMITIDHLDGVKTVYMHNSSLLVARGDEVKQGDVIALSGNTGKSTGPHLHFEVRINGTAVNPIEYVNPENPRPVNTAPEVDANAEAWRPYIEQAFSELGYVATEEKIAAIIRQIHTESRGDQFVIQGVIDSNSGKPIKIGDGTCPWCPSPNGKSCGNTNIGHGLLQFIPTTFYDNMVEGHNNIYNGYDQICACISMLEKRAGAYTDYIGKGHGWG